MEKRKTGRVIVTSILNYVIQAGLILLVLFHDFSSKDAAIIATLLVMLYGIGTSQTATESTISGMHFVTLANLIRGTQNGDEDSIEGMTRKETPFTFVQALFGLGIAIVGAIRLVYLLVIAPSTA